MTPWKPTDGRLAVRRRPLLVLLGLLIAAAAVVTLVVVIRHSSGTPSAGTSAAGGPSVATPPVGSSPAGTPSVGSSAPAGRTSSAAVGAGAAGTSTRPGPSSSQPAGITFGYRLFGLSRSRIDSALTDVVSMHMTWIRVDMSWASLQPTVTGPYNWAPLDSVVASARRHRLKVLGLLSYTPAWARSPGCSTFTCPPRRAGEFARFAGTVAARYRDDGVTSFEVWNEPNLNLFWTSPNPLRYRALLAATVTSLRATGRGVRILLGGLAVTADSGANLSAATFVRQACAGRTCRVDAVGYDPYTYPALPSSTTRPLNAFQQLINPAAGTTGLTAALAAVGLGTTPVWITGFGAPTARTAAGGPQAVSEQTQARIVTDGLRLARGGTGRIGGYFVDTLQDSTARKGGTGFGLERADGSHKPAFTALAGALAP